MKYKHKRTNKEFDFDILLYDNIDTEEFIDENTNILFKIVEVWEAGVIVRRAITRQEVMIKIRKYDFIFSLDWFDDNYERLN